MKSEKSDFSYSETEINLHFDIFIFHLQIVADS